MRLVLGIRPPTSRQRQACVAIGYVAALLISRSHNVVMALNHFCCVSAILTKRFDIWWSALVTKCYLLILQTNCQLNNFDESETFAVCVWWVLRSYFPYVSAFRLQNKNTQHQESLGTYFSYMTKQHDIPDPLEIGISHSLLDPCQTTGFTYCARHWWEVWEQHINMPTGQFLKGSTLM